MRFRNALVFSPLIVGLTLGCSEGESAKPATPANTGATTPTDQKASNKQKPTRQLGPEGVVP
jgi:hypothetical protein